MPLTRFVRSLYPPVGSVPNPWLVQFSDIGDRLGKGESLVILSLVLLAVGYGLKHPQWKDAGWQSLIAHGLAALSANILKHAIGRPRPKFMHAGNLEFSPAGGSGWDSFPSGHAAAAITVATVLATKFPRARWPILAAAVAIAASRVLRGSHYLTDVAGGAALGCVMGVIATHPWREWRSSAGMAICRMTPFFVATLALVWTIVHLPSEAWPFQQFLWGGLLLTLAALVGPCLVDGAVVMVPGLAVRTAGSQSRGTGVRNDDRLTVCHNHCVARLCCTLVGWSHWSDRVHGGRSCGATGGHGRGSVRRGHAIGVGSELCPERHRADVVWSVSSVRSI